MPVEVARGAEVGGFVGDHLEEDAQDVAVAFVPEAEPGFGAFAHGESGSAADSPPAAAAAAPTVAVPGSGAVAISPLVVYDHAGSLPRVIEHPPAPQRHQERHLRPPLRRAAIPALDHIQPQIYPPHDPAPSIPRPRRSSHDRRDGASTAGIVQPVHTKPHALQAHA